MVVCLPDVREPRSTFTNHFDSGASQAAGGKYPCQAAVFQRMPNAAC